MTKRTFIFAHQTARQSAANFALHEAPDGWVATFSEPTRSSLQNARLWAMLGDVAKQVDWHGRKLDAEDWKHIFSASLSQQRVVPNLDSTGFVVLGKSTSKMSKREMSDLIELISSFGAERGVKWSEPA